MMRVTVAGDQSSLYRMAADDIGELVAHRKDAVLCLAAGHTSIGLFRELAARQKRGEIDLTSVRLVGLDEWLGSEIDETESCYGFLKRYFLNLVPVKKENCYFFRSDALNVQAEADRIAGFIQNSGGIDYMLLGLGMNGHLGLNEPGTSFEESIHTVRIEAVTEKVAQKYFSRPVQLEYGITLGPADILEAGKAVLLVQGVHKREILKRLMESDIKEDIPASLLKRHGNAWLLADAEAMDERDDGK